MMIITLDSHISLQFWFGHIIRCTLSLVVDLQHGHLLLSQKLSTFPFLSNTKTSAYMLCHPEYQNYFEQESSHYLRDLGVLGT